MGDVAVAHGVRERPGDVVLPADLGEPLGTEAPVEGLEGPILIGWLRWGRSGARHADDATAALVRPPSIALRVPGRSGQVACGTLGFPLRAAVFRP